MFNIHEWRKVLGLDTLRDDTGLHAVVCPHCKHTLPVPNIQAFECQQLIYLKCEFCQKGLNKEEINNAYREYREKKENE